MCGADTVGLALLKEVNGRRSILAWLRDSSHGIIYTSSQPAALALQCVQCCGLDMCMPLISLLLISFNCLCPAPSVLQA